MSTSTSVTLWCDHGDCTAWADHGNKSVTVTRRLAAREGWRQGRLAALRDLCPEHARFYPTRGDES